MRLSDLIEKSAIAIKNHGDIEVRLHLGGGDRDSHSDPKWIGTFWFEPEAVVTQVIEKNVSVFTLIAIE